MATELEPVDYKRCQAEWTTPTPFALGGTHKTTRCSNEPAVVAREIVAGKDGQKGAMSICLECLPIYMAEAHDPKRHEVVSISAEHEGAEP